MALKDVLHGVTQYLPLWQLCLILVPVFVVTRFFYQRYASDLRSIPGPFLASGSRLWKTWSIYKGHTETDHIALHAKYGSLVRIAPNEISFSNPETARKILSPASGFHKTDFYWVFPPPENPDIFTEIREDVHAQKKRHVSAAYSMASMHSYAKYIDDTARRLVEKLGKFDGAASSGKEEGAAGCDLGAWLHYFAFDVLGEVAFSRDFGFLTAGRDVEGVIRCIDDTQWYDGLVGQMPEWHWVLRLNPLKKYLTWFFPDEMLLVTRIALGEMEKRKLEPENGGRKDLLGNLFAAQEKSDGKFGMGDVFAVAHGAIFAGSDSTASTMQSFFHEVFRNPEVYQRLQKEIDDAAESGRLSDVPQWSEVQDLPYFQACLKEAMRLRPAVGLNIVRYVPPQGVELEGRFYKGGTRIALNGWALHRDEATFGAEPGKFRPERWLGDEGKKMERYLFTFGGGSHLCIGKNLALLEMNKTLPLLLRTFDFRLVRPQAPLKHHTTFFVVQSGLDVHVSRRKHS